MHQRHRSISSSESRANWRGRSIAALTVVVVLSGLAFAPAHAATPVTSAGSATPADPTELTVGNSDAPGAISPGPPASAGPSSASGATTAVAPVYTFGREPLADVTYWASQKAACGLTPAQLATIMLAPTYPETGASGTSAPSPMTLSRFDTQASLYAFGDASTPYQRAFWHPGIGIWAFDSAGGWNLTAAQAISTTTSAQQAAITMSARWCSASAITDPVQRRASVWAPWHGCNAGACETFYQAMYDPAGPKVQVDDSVTRDGGMVTHSCRVDGWGDVPCAYVDPAKAQGFRNWTIPSWGRSPVSAPFYVLSHNGQEYRVWLAGDSGYDTGISAFKPITSNARTSLTWAKGDFLCDLTAGRGACNWTGWIPHGGSWKGKPAVATNADGRLEMFAIGEDGSVFDAWQISPNGSWSGWVAFPGLNGSTAIAATRGRDGYLVLTAVTGSGAVSVNVQRASGWSGWSRLGGGIAGSLAITANQDGRLEVFGLDAGGSVWHSWQLVGGGWSALTQLGGQALTGLATAVNQDGRIEVFAVGGNHVLYHVWQVARNASYSGWQGLGGSVTGTPSTVNDLDGRIEVLSRGTDNHLYDVWQTSPNGSWSAPASLGGSVVGDPAVGVGVGGRLTAVAFVAPNATTLSVNAQSSGGGAFSGWTPMP